ncbi:hypothetical protein [Nonomuraea sp. B5E05]|uniref:hypothetical protein n=1 Tax=Nonomuraea sp. B5E05 TaxID=3153569 RepID=UPI0032607B5B
MASPLTGPAPVQAGPAAPGTWPFLLPFVVYVLHTLEELQGFAAWAGRYFGPETTGMFAAYHIPLMLLVLVCSWRASVAGRHGAWVVLATAFQRQFSVNALFHLSVGAADQLPVAYSEKISSSTRRALAASSSSSPTV